MSISKYFLNDFRQGATIILKHLFKPVVTMQYPDEKWIPYARFRGATGLIKEKCAVCCMCTNVCPSQAITIIGAENEKGEKVIKEFQIDLTRCIFCGLCAEFCPRNAIVSTSAYELTVYDKKELILKLPKLEEMAKNFSATNEGGYVVKIKK